MQFVSGQTSSVWSWLCGEWSLVAMDDGQLAHLCYEIVSEEISTLVIQQQQQLEPRKRLSSAQIYWLSP